MKRLIYILFICVCVNSYGQKIDISNTPKLIQPGQYFSLFFTLLHTDSLPNGFKNRLKLPTNWKILTEKKLPIDKDSFSTKYIYTISTPNQAASGAYPIDFQIVVSDTVLIYKKAIVNIDVVKHIEIVPLNQPEFVKEGDVLKIEYLIQNLGNQTERLKIETTRGVVDNVKDSVYINPNSYLKVLVKQNIPQTDNSHSWQTSADLKVSFSNQTAPIFQFVSIPVYSTKIKKNDPYLRFPIQIGGAYMRYSVGKQTLSAYQYTAEGSGFLDFSKKHHLDFTVRGPNQAAFPTIGSYDQYSMSYTYLSKTKITAGDYVLRFNNLMEFGRFGRGLKVEQNTERGNTTLFYQHARFFPNQKDAFGGSYKWHLKGESNIGVNFISKNLNYNNLNFHSNLLGVSSFFKKEKFVNETELALGYAQNKLDIGFFNKFNFIYKRLNVNSEVVHAGKNFYGFYTNSLLLVNGVNYRLSKKISIGANANISKINPSLDVIKYATSPYSTTLTAFISYQPDSKNQLFLNYTNQEREDRQKPSTFHFKEDFVNFSYNLNTYKFTLFSQARYGYAQNLMTVDNTGKKEATAYILQPSVALLPWFWVGGYSEYQHTTKFSANDKYQNLYYYGGNVRMNYKKSISLNFMYRNNYAPDEFFEKRSFIDGSLVFDFPKHQLSLNTGKSYIPNLSTNEENTQFLSVRYVAKLNVPIKKDKKLGHLSGQVICLSNSIKKEGILMQVGQYKSLTDSNGIFSFPNLMPNTYYITMPYNSSLVGVVSTLKTPIEARIKADSTVFLTIPLVKTGGVVGSVNFENIEKSSLEKPIVYVKLFNATESFVTELNNKNEFSFKEMKPGLWKLKAIILGKNEQFEILNAEQDIEIESDQIKKSSFLVKTIERKVQFSGKSFHISSQK